MSTEQLTPEQKAQNDYEISAAFRFLSLNPRIVQCEENALLLNSYLKQHNLSFDVENLETAAYALEHELRYTDSPAEPEKQKEVTYAWGSKLTKGAIASMSKADFKKFLHDPVFTQQLSDLGIKTA